MLLYQVLSSIFLAAAVFADPAPISDDSPPGALFKARFTRDDIQGLIHFSSYNGYVLTFFFIEGLPAEGGPFEYSIHQARVPRYFDCRKTLGVFDPYDGVPHAATEAEYKVGDLSGKHGNMPDTFFTGVYFDDYLSLNPQNPAYFADLSVVIRRVDGKRIACANLIASPINEIPDWVEKKAKGLYDDMMKKKKIDADSS